MNKMNTIDLKTVPKEHREYFHLTSKLYNNYNDLFSAYNRILLLNKIDIIRQMIISNRKKRKSLRKALRITYKGLRNIKDLKVLGTLNES